MNLYAKKAIESATLWSCGDILAQFVGHRMQADDPKHNKDGGSWYNPARTLRSAAFAATVYTPLAVTWYGRLSRKFPGTTTADLAKKVLADQAMFGPTLVACFFLVMPMFEGKSPRDSVARMEREFWGSLKMNWSVWGPIQVINFALIPPQHWVLVCNCVSIPWSAFLAYRNAGAGH